MKHTKIYTYLRNLSPEPSGEDPDPVIFGLPDPLLFLPDSDPTCNNVYICHFYTYLRYTIFCHFELRSDSDPVFISVEPDPGENFRILTTLPEPFMNEGLTPD